jgi:hypothetical protein
MKELFFFFSFCLTSAEYFIFFGGKTPDERDIIAVMTLRSSDAFFCFCFGPRSERGGRSRFTPALEQ